MSQHQEKVRLWVSSIACLGQPSWVSHLVCGRHRASFLLLLFFFRVDVVICLSTTVRNDTLQDAKEHRVSVKCRKQLRVEELEMVNRPGCCLVWHSFLRECAGTPVKNTGCHSLLMCFPLIILCSHLCAMLAFCHKKAVSFS